MPLPIRKNSATYRKITDIVEHPSVLLQRPRLASLIAAIAAQATWLENLAALAFCDMLNAEEDAALAIYLGFVDRGSRDIAFNEVAKLKLPAELQKGATDLQRELRTRLKERNLVVHGTWAISPGLPDSLLLTDARKLIKHRPASRIDTEAPIMLNKQMAEQFTWFKYEEPDFNEILTRLYHFEICYRDFLDALEAHLLSR